MLQTSHNPEHSLKVGVSLHASSLGRTDVSSHGSREPGPITGTQVAVTKKLVHISVCVPEILKIVIITVPILPTIYLKK